MRYATAIALLLVTSLGAAGCGGEEGSERSSPGVSVEDPGPVHVHGLGVNPADDALFVATHTGLFRAAPGQRKAERVAGRYQDTMGFTVVGPDRFLGSGHPDGRDDLPPFLGLMRTDDAGGSWKPVSLLGERDFHVLEASGTRVYGYGSDFKTRQEGLLVSDDGGRSWEERTVPEPLVSLAIDPEDPDRVLAAGEIGLYSSSDGARRWTSLSGEPGLLAWPSGGSVYAVAPDGGISRSAAQASDWEPVGDTGGPPSAFESAGGELYVALHDGTVKRSDDGGRSWTVRSSP
jgi:hypothetical protein